GRARRSRNLDRELALVVVVDVGRRLGLPEQGQRRGERRQRIEILAGQRSLLVARAVEPRDRVLERIGERRDLEHLRRRVERVQPTSELLARPLLRGRGGEERERAAQ